MGDSDCKPGPLDYARSGSSSTGAHRRSLNKWGWAAIFAGCGLAAFAIAAGVVCANGWLSDEVFDRIAVMLGLLFLLGAATCVVGIALCAAAASRHE